MSWLASIMETKNALTELGKKPDAVLLSYRTYLSMAESSGAWPLNRDLVKRVAGCEPLWCENLAHGQMIFLQNGEYVGQVHIGGKI